MTFEFCLSGKVALTQDCMDPELAHDVDPKLELAAQKGRPGCMVRASFDIAPNARSLGAR
jgi:hypothetical protein